MSESKIYMLTETSDFMMSYVIETDNGRLIIVDGGRAEDVPLLKQYVDGRKIAAWFLTHPHVDHVTAFNDIVMNDREGFDFDAVYYNYPPVEFLEKNNDGDAFCARDMEKIVPKLGDKLHRVFRGDSIQIDNIKVDVLYNWHEEFTRNAFNDSSIVFKLDSGRHTMVFLGDLGPEGGDKLLEESRDLLKADYCQMAHHGHMCVSPEVYMAIDPEVCFWNAADWLWNEPPRHIGYRMYGEMMTRQWMERLGINKHYVTKDGTAEVPF